MTEKERLLHLALSGKFTGKGKQGQCHSCQSEKTLTAGLPLATTIFGTG